MADFAISVRDVVKQYQVRHQKGRTLKEASRRTRTRLAEIRRERLGLTRRNLKALLPRWPGH